MEIDSVEGYWSKREAHFLREAQLKVNPPLSLLELRNMEIEEAKKKAEAAIIEKTIRWRLREWWETHRPHIVWGRYWEDL